MPGRSKDLSVGQRDSIVELIRGGHSHGKVASMLKYRKLQCTTYLKSMVHGVVQKMPKNWGDEKVWTIAMAEKLSEI